MPSVGSARPTLTVVHSLGEALELCRLRGEAKAFVIGGGQIFEQALPIADEMIVTMIDRPCVTGDTFFPPWDPAEWEALEVTTRPPLRIILYTRKQPPHAA
jgi:dihydrofolate reductase